MLEKEKCMNLFSLPSFQEFRRKVKCGFYANVSVERSGFELGAPKFLISVVNHLTTVTLRCYKFISFVLFIIFL